MEHQALHRLLPPHMKEETSSCVELSIWCQRTPSPPLSKPLFLINTQDWHNAAGDQSACRCQQWKTTKDKEDLEQTRAGRILINALVFFYDACDGMNKRWSQLISAVYFYWRGGLFITATDDNSTKQPAKFFSFFFLKDP